MTARWAYAALALLVLAGGGLSYGLTRGTDTVAEVEECDTCSARKKDLSRLREALNPPDNGQE